MSERLRQPAAYLIVIIFLVTLAVLLATNYPAAILLVIGCLLALPTPRLIRRATPVFRGMVERVSRHWILISGVILIACVGLNLLVLFDILSFGQNASDVRFFITIRPDPSKLDTFQIENRPGGSRTQATGIPRGLFLREVTIYPRNSSDASADVELRDFPKGSFYAAKSAWDVTHSVYIDTEQITWSVEDPSGGIVFAYVPYPFYFVKPLIEPFISAAYLTPWLIGLVGLVGMIIAAPILRTVLFAPVLKRLGFKSRVENETPEQTVINVSGDLNVGRDFVGHDKTTHGDEINTQGDVTKINHE